MEIVRENYLVEVMLSVGIKKVMKKIVMNKKRSLPQSGGEEQKRNGSRSVPREGREGKGMGT